MRNTILIIVLSLAIFGCNKDTTPGTPGLTFKSVNATVIPYLQQIQFTLSFNDVNGNLDSIYVLRINPTCNVFRDSTELPTFPSYKKQSGDLLITYENGVGPNPIFDTCSPSVNDTCYFQFVVKDLSGKTSDTVRSPQIVLLKQ